MIARFVDVLLDGTLVGVGPAAGVFAAHDALVVPPLDPALQLGGAQRVERMGAIERVEDLVDAVQRSARLLVFLGLHEERIQIHLLHVAAACHLQEHAERGLGVLAGEQAGAVRRQLALAVPLEQCKTNGEQCDPGEERQRCKADVEDEGENRVVQRMAAHHVAQFVAEQGAHLVVIEQLQRAGVDDDERPVHAEGAGVDERRLRHEQIGPHFPVHRRQHVGVECVEPRELRRAHAYGIGLEQQPDAALTDEGEHLLHHFVEPRD